MRLTTVCNLYETIALCLLGLLQMVAGQGAGPMGSISDYYDAAFGNPFLGYWRNPGFRNPYGTVSNPYLQPGGLDVLGSGNPYRTNAFLGDRPAISSPSYAYDRMPNVFELPGSYGGAGYQMPPLGMGAAAGYGGYGMMPGGAYPAYGYGMPPVAVDRRTPADRALQDLLPSTYVNRPFYP